MHIGRVVAGGLMHIPPVRATRCLAMHIGGIAQRDVANDG